MSLASLASWFNTAFPQQRMRDGDVLEAIRSGGWRDRFRLDVVGPVRLKHDYVGRIS